MTVFKNYFKIVKRHYLLIGLYSVVFISIAIIFSTFDTTPQLSYEREMVNISVVDKSNSKLSKATTKYLESISTLKKIDDLTLQDALFNSDISAILTFPSDFKENQKIEIQNRVDDMNALLITRSVDRFLNTLDVYLTQNDSFEIAYQKSTSDLSEVVEVNLIESKNDLSLLSSSLGFFNSLNYVLSAQIILVVTLIMNSYKKEPLLSRQKVSAVNKRFFDFQLIFGHLIMGVLIWLLYILVYIILLTNQIGEPSFKLLLLNSFVFMISSVAFSYMISKFIRSDSAISVITNTYALGTSFISGAFVPMSLLPDFTISLAKLFPSYYYISNNHLIMDNPTFSSMQSNLFVLIGFTLAFIIVSMLLKQTKKM